MMYVSQIIMLYTLNSHSAVYQLYLNKLEYKNKHPYKKVTLIQIRFDMPLESEKRQCG